jgi:PAP2 superfamily protein
MRRIESDTTGTGGTWKGLLNGADPMKTALTVAILATVFEVSSSGSFYGSSMASVFMSLALAGAAVTLLVIQPSWINFASVAVGALVLAGFDYRILRFQPRFMAVFSFLGLSSLAVMGTRTIWARNRNRAIFPYAFLPTVLFLASEDMASTLLDYTEKLHPKTFDLFLYSFDCSLRVQFSFLVGQIYSRHLWFRFAGLLFYIALPLPLALVYAAHVRRRGKQALPVMLAFLVTGPLGVLFYNLVPATGPVHVFGPDFPWHPALTSQVRYLVLQTIPVTSARNAIPSLHMAWMLLAWWNSKGLSRWIRAIVLVFVIFTVLATLGIGEHYFVDLVVAFPFALMVQALCLYPLSFKSGARRAAFLFGTLASLAWMALLSFAIPLFWISPVIPWTMVVATISLSIWLMYRLQNEEFTNRLALQETGAEARSMATAG